MINGSNARSAILQYTEALARIPSIVNTSGEKNLAMYLYGIISAFPYFQNHPEQVFLQQTLDDSIERYNISAFIKGTGGSSPDTVILMGHLDTVGLEDYGRLKDFACDPPALMRAFKKESLPPEVARDLLSGDWLFGRGVLDMKSGLAAHLFLFEYFASHPESLTGNIVLLFACDEEDSSHGMLSALRLLDGWKRSEGFNYILAVNTDFTAPRFTGDPERNIYLGTVGKLLPAFYITGAETHVGSCFEGFDPNLLAAEIIRRINYSPQFCNESHGELTVPPVSLKLTDLKPSYSVQTALASLVYFNFFVHSWSPKDVLRLLKTAAEEAFEDVLKEYQKRYEAFCNIKGEYFKPIPWHPRVITYEEMQDQLILQHGSAFLQHMDMYKARLLQDLTLDTRMFGVKIVEESWKWMIDSSPAVILFIPHLYSPRVEFNPNTERERKIVLSLEKVLHDVQEDYPHPISLRHFFPYISDMSFMTLSDTDEEIETIRKNNPGWGSKHDVDYDLIRQINVPVINIGPYGLDAHKKFERMEIRYSTEIVPDLIYRLIQELL